MSCHCESCDETKPSSDGGRERLRRVERTRGIAAFMVGGPGLDPAVLETRKTAWMRQLNPQGDEVGAFFVAHAVRASFRLERCDHAHQAMVAAAELDLEEAGDDEEIAAADRNEPNRRFNLLLRYEMHTERILIKLVDGLRARAEIALDEGCLPQPVAASPQPNSARNEPISAARAMPSVEESDDSERDCGDLDSANTPRTNPSEDESPLVPEKSDYVKRLEAKYGDLSPGKIRNNK